MSCAPDPPVSIYLSGWTEGHVSKAGKKVSFACRVTGGNPPPTVSWYRRGSLLASPKTTNVGPKSKNSKTAKVVGHLSQVVRSDLELVLVAEDDGGAVECHGNSDLLDIPLADNVTLSVMCKYWYILFILFLLCYWSITIFI